LALFGRRPPQLTEGFVMPASKNLHSNGLAAFAIVRNTTLIESVARTSAVCR
jgi:hypothetical protein